MQYMLDQTNKSTDDITNKLEKINRIKSHTCTYVHNIFAKKKEKYVSIYMYVHQEAP